MLISAVKEVAAALGDLISATKNASGKHAKDPSMGSLKDSAQVGYRGNRSGYYSDRERSGYHSDRDRTGYHSDRDRTGYHSDRDGMYNSYDSDLNRSPWPMGVA